MGWCGFSGVVFVENHDDCCCGDQGDFPAEWLTEAESQRRSALYAAERMERDSHAGLAGRDNGVRRMIRSRRREAATAGGGSVARSSNGGMSEKSLQQKVQSLATEGGWRWHHCAHAAGCEGGRGWPDLIMLRGSELLAVELKSDRGTVAVAQTRWLFAWREVGAECHVWQPSDLDTIKKRLAPAPDG